MGIKGCPKKKRIYPTKQIGNGNVLTRPNDSQMIGHSTEWSHLYGGVHADALCLMLGLAFLPCLEQNLEDGSLPSRTSRCNPSLRGRTRSVFVTILHRLKNRYDLYEISRWNLPFCNLSLSTSIAGTLLTVQCIPYRVGISLVITSSPPSDPDRFCLVQVRNRLD